MNAPSKKPKAAETVENVLNEMDKQRESNLRIWNALGKTDPAHTKQFSRAGGFKGTAVKPMWVIQRLTEYFGPCGTGWGTDEPRFETIHATEGEVLVYCTVAGWYVDTVTGDRKSVYGVGGDKAVARNKYGMFADDEAFKKAFTDAVNNAFKFVGVAADIHMGLFDDSKYLAEVTAEFHPKPDPAPSAKRVPLDGPYTSKTQLWGAVKAFVHTANGMADLGEWIAYRDSKDVVEMLDQCKRDAPALWSEGLPDVPEFEPLQIFIARKTRELEEHETVRG